MPRYRKIPTDIRSAPDLSRALTDMGLKNVEVHAQPVPLDDWIGRPTEVHAHVVVRRKDLGASSDDMGFARNERGTFDLIVSEIHLFRFDRRWMADLAQRTKTTLPEGGTIQFAAGTVGAPTKSPLVAPPRPQNVSSAPATRPTGSTPTIPPAVDPTSANSSSLARVRAESAKLVEDLAKSQKLSGLGCLLYFAPVVLWFVLTEVSGGARNLAALGVLMIPWTIVYVIALSIAMTARFSRRMRKFKAGLPPGSQMREEALAHLKTLAAQKKSFVTQQAERAAKDLEAKVDAALTRRPPTQPRGPGSRGT